MSKYGSCFRDWDEDQRMGGSCRKIRDWITTSHTSLYLHSKAPRQQFMTTPCEAIMEDTRETEARSEAGLSYQ